MGNLMRYRLPYPRMDRVNAMVPNIKHGEWVKFSDIGDAIVELYAKWRVSAGKNVDATEVDNFIHWVQQQHHS